MKLLRTALIVIGILLLIAGIGGGALSMIMPLSDDCYAAEQLGRSANEAAKAAEAAKGTPQQAVLETKAKESAESAKPWIQRCADAKSKANTLFYAALVTAVLGVFISILGFFVLRKK